MKKLSLLILALVSSTVVFSQDLTMGPAFKNAQIGKVTGPKLVLLYDSEPNGLMGPKAKNTEVWMRSSKSKLKVGFRDEINNPQGLQAKNSNPWDKPKPKAESKAAYVEPKSMRPKRSWLH
jgi:hypothetical protein